MPLSPRSFLTELSLPRLRPAPLSAGTAAMLRTFADRYASSRNASRPRCPCGCVLFTVGPLCMTCVAEQEIRAERCWAVVAFALRCGPVAFVAVRAAS